MLDLTEIINRAQSAPRQTTDVEVVFDSGVAADLAGAREEQVDLTARIEQIENDLADQLEDLANDARAGDGRSRQARKTATETAAPLKARLEELATSIDGLQDRSAESVVVFRFTALLPHEWTDLCAHSIPRDDHPEDAGRDYNMDDVTRIAATRSGVRVIDGDTVPVPAEVWATIWDTLHRVELRQIKLAVFTLNEYSGIAAHSEAVAAARKVLTAQQATRSTSPSTSESTRADSTDGNPSPSPTTSTTAKAA